MPQDKAFAVVEKEYLAERDAIDRQLDATFDESKSGATETKEEPQEAAKSDSDVLRPWGALRLVPYGAGKVHGPRAR